MRWFIKTVFAVILVACLGACSQEGETGLQGQVLFQEKPLAKAQIEVYLKTEKDRSVQPFTVVVSDAQGRYRVDLPSGEYSLVAKKRDVRESGRTRMLMAEAPGNPQKIADTILRVPTFTLYEMGQQGKLVADADTGLFGQVLFEGQPTSRAFVYIYAEGITDLMGPSYSESVQTDAEGRFDVALPAGRYQLVARKRGDGERSGELQAGDLNGSYPDNPVTVRRGERLEITSIELQEVDATKKQARQDSGTFAPTETLIHGLVVDEDDLPVSGVYLFAYLDSRMIGKPASISAPTDDSGRFSLFLTDGGTYYVGARSNFGGPLEPGEWVGTYDVAADHSVVIADGDRSDLGRILVREVW